MSETSNRRGIPQRGFVARRMWINTGRVCFITGNGFSLSVWLFGQWNRIQVSRG